MSYRIRQRLEKLEKTLNKKSSQFPSVTPNGSAADSDHHSRVTQSERVANGASDHLRDVTQPRRVTPGPGDETILVKLPTSEVPDARPDPKPRKHPHLWQSYLWWNEVMEMRKRHVLRISSSERGKSNLDAQFEKDTMESIGLDPMVNNLKKAMVFYGEQVSVWDWVTSIKGMGQGGLAAQLLAQIDDIAKFDTVASLWRFAGFAVIEGQAEKNQKGQKSKFNRRLKGICFNIADSFIKQQTPHYIDIYYAEKERQRALYPDVLCRDCGCKWEECPSKKKHVKKYSDAHIHNRAWRKMVKAFLRDLWIEWKG